MLAPIPEAILAQLGSDYVNNSFLMAWSHTLLNTSLYPIVPKPAFFDRFSAELNKAKATTQPWLHQDYPKIASALPQSLINYGNAAVAALDELIPALAATKPDRALVVELIEALRREAQDQQNVVLALRAKVDAFAPQVLAVATESAKVASEALEVAGAANRKVLSLQARIGELLQELSATGADAKNAMKGAATTGATLSMTLMSFTISAGVGAAAFPVFGLAGAFIGIGVNAAIEASKSQRVQHLIREIGQLTLELDAEQHQAAVLHTIAKSLEKLADFAGDATSNMKGSVHHWEDITSNLDLLRELLDQPALELRRLIPLNQARLRAAQTAWKKIVEGAGKVQASVLKPATQIELKVAP